MTASAITGSLLLAASAPPAQAAMLAPAARTAAQAMLPAPPSDTDRAAAFAEPAIVTVSVAWQGYVRDGSGSLMDAAQVQVVTRCTGAGVTGDGYLVTARSCLDAETAAPAAFTQVVNRRVADGRTSSAGAAELLNSLNETGTFDGGPASSGATRTVTVRRAVTPDGPLPATVVSLPASVVSDAALLKIDRSNQPILPLAGNNDLSIGTSVVTLECVENSDTAVRPIARREMVTTTLPPLSITPLDSTTATPSAGPDPVVLPSGVVITKDASLAGLVVDHVGGRDILVGASAIKDLLTGAAATAELGEVDTDFRDGLDAYYAGNYTNSIEKFDSVLAIIPSHVQAHAYREQAQTLRAAQGGGPIPDRGPVSAFRGWLNGKSGIIVGIGVLVAIAIFLVRRRRPDKDTAEPGEFTEPDRSEHSEV